jgi:putative intracellular protease/amidase
MSRTVHVFVFDTLADWEPGYAIAGINNPRFQREPGRYAVRTVSLGGRPVTTIGGLRIQPDGPLETLAPTESAMFILPGGEAWDGGKNVEAVDHARACLEAGVPVAAICGATAGLARGGLLDARAHTSNAREYLAATGYRGLEHYRDEPVVADGDLITAPAMAPLEFARAIFARLDLYAPAVLDAWYGLFSTRRPEYFAALVAAIETERSAKTAGV